MQTCASSLKISFRSILFSHQLLVLHQCHRHRFLSFVSTATSALPQYSTYSNATLAIMFDVGTRVLRGPDWKWGNQDGPSLGLVTLNMSLHNAPGWVHAQFDNGHVNSYRVGAQGAFDLFRLYGESTSKLHCCFAHLCLKKNVVSTIKPEELTSPLLVFAPALYAKESLLC